MGSGVGDPFGPRCNKGDIMGCGVLFPRDFEFRSDSEEEAEQPQVPFIFPFDTRYFKSQGMQEKTQS